MDAESFAFVLSAVLASAAFVLLMLLGLLAVDGWGAKK